MSTGTYFSKVKLVTRSRGSSAPLAPIDTQSFMDDARGTMSAPLQSPVHHFVTLPFDIPEYDMPTVSQMIDDGTVSSPVYPEWLLPNDYFDSVPQQQQSSFVPAIVEPVEVDISVAAPTPMPSPIDANMFNQALTRHYEMQ